MQELCVKELLLKEFCVKGVYLEELFGEDVHVQELSVKELFFCQAKCNPSSLYVSSAGVNYQIPRKNDLIPFVAVHCYSGKRVADRSGIIPVCKGRSKIYVNHGLSACGVHWMGSFFGGGMLISSKLLRTAKSF